VANTVSNLIGSAMGPPPANQARYCAFVATPAIVSINEIKPDITAGADLIELLVTQGGPLAGYQVRSNPTAASSGTAIATLPGICAATGDFVVIHLTPAIDPATSETTAKNENPSATYAFNYDAAWDVRGGSSGLAMTNLIVAIRNPAGVWIDGAAFSNSAATTQTTRDALAFIQASGFWLPADCGGVACGDATNPTAQGISANWNTLGSDASTSIRRTANTKNAAAWVVGTSTFGGTN